MTHTPTESNPHPGIVQAPRLHFFRAQHHYMEPSGAPFRGAIDIAAEAYAGFSDVQEAISAYNALAGQYRHHDSERNRLYREAPEAEQQYHRDVRTTLAEGGDIADLVNPRSAMEAEGDEHTQKCTAIKRALEAQQAHINRLTYGDLSRQACAAYDEKLPGIAKRLHALLDELGPLAREWDDALSARHMLAIRDLFGANHRGVKDGLTDLHSIIAQARAALAQYDQLRDEEDVVRSFRAAKA